MKKILIVNNNMDTGGIQKSLLNLLHALHDQYDITLLLFSQSGTLLKKIPENVSVISPGKRYCMLGLTRSELRKYPGLYIFKALLMQVSKLLSRRIAVNILGTGIGKIGGYDAVISYSHLPDYHTFMSGCGDFVLDKTICDHKICIIHCDYLNSGCGSEKGIPEYKEFDKIACCSESVRKRFLEGTHISENRVFTMRNFYDPYVIKMAEDNPYCYENQFLNLVSVARVSPEKGIDRAILALYHCKRKDIRYYIVGDGPQRSLLEQKVSDCGLNDQVYFVGEQSNPYRYMLYADYLLVPSLHEAAPMVFDEANAIGLQILTTETTSAREMAANGIVCDNSQTGIDSMIRNLKKSGLHHAIQADNALQINQFMQLIKH